MIEICGTRPDSSHVLAEDPRRSRRAPRCPPACRAPPDSTKPTTGAPGWPARRSTRTIVSAWASPSEPPTKLGVLRVAEHRPAVDRAGAADHAVAGPGAAAQPPRGDAGADRREATPGRTAARAARAASRLGAGDAAVCSHDRGGRSLAAVHAEAEHGVVAAEAERVRDRDGRRPSPFGALERRAAVGHVVEVEPLVALLPADRRRRDAVAQRERAWRPPRPRRRRRAGGRSPTSSRRPGPRRRALAERRLERLGLGAVVERRRGAVGVDVVDVVGRRARRRRAPAPIARAAPPALGLGGGEVVGVGGRAVAAQLAEDRAPRARPPPASSSTSTPAPSPITKPSRRASKGREMPARRRGAHRREGRLGERRERASAPPATTASASPGWIIRSGGADRVGAGGAGRHGAVRRAAQAVAHRDRAGAPRCASSAGRRAARPPPRPRSSSTSCWSSIEPMPPMPGADHAADAVGVDTGSSSPQPASASASSPPPTASWVKRSLRRASLRVRCVASGRTRGSARRRPRSRLARRPALDQRRAPTPSGVTAPTPGDDDRAALVMTARATTRSIASPTVFTSLPSSPLSSTPNSSSTIWASSTRSSESTSSASNVGVAGDLVALGAELLERVEDALLDCSQS